MYLPRVLIVSDHPFNGECLLALLSTFQSVNLIDEVVDYKTAQNIYCSGEVDVLLVDVYEDSCHDTIRTLIDHFSASKTLAITVSSNEWFLSSLLHCGANGIFVSTAPANKLCEAISIVFKNEWYLPDEFHSSLSGEISSIKIPELNGTSNDDLDKLELETLTSREMEILKLMVKGEPSSQIAEELFISPSTVFTHRKHILKKLGFSSTPTLIRCALEQGVL